LVNVLGLLTVLMNLRQPAESFWTFPVLKVLTILLEFE